MLSPECLEAIRKIEALTAYRANPKIGAGPAEGSWAWRLERELERRFGVAHAVVCSGGTAALHTLLAAIDVRGYEVVTSPITFSATAAAIVLAGGIPIFADVNQDGIIDEETAAKVCTCSTRAVIPVHLFGQRRFDLKNVGGDGCIVEDACQAVGARPHAGNHGAYSFGARKQVRCGEGGAIVTDSEEVAGRCRRFINHAENFSMDVGGNYRLAEVPACIAFHSLKEFKDGTPYAVIDPAGVPYLDRHLGHYPAFQRYMRGPLPNADRFLKETRIRYV